MQNEHFSSRATMVAIEMQQNDPEIKRYKASSATGIKLQTQNYSPITHKCQTQYILYQRYHEIWIHEIRIGIDNPKNWSEGPLYWWKSRIWGLSSFFFGGRWNCYWFIKVFSFELCFLCPFNVETDKIAHVDGSIKHLGMNEENKIR